MWQERSLQKPVLLQEEALQLKQANLSDLLPLSVRIDSLQRELVQISPPSMLACFGPRNTFGTKAKIFTSIDLR